MSTPVDVNRVRGDLHRLLQERDPRRVLDSLETVVVLAYLKDCGLAVGAGTGEAPDTIEGWSAWAVRHSRGF